MRRRAVVVGAGNIGLATGRLWEKLGGEVAYWDTSAAVRHSLAAAGHQTLQHLLLDEADIVFVCVPTPTLAGRLSTAPVDAALSDIAAAANGPHLSVVLRSTVLPGMNEALMRSARSLKPSIELSWAYWPSFAREAFAFEDELAPHAVVVGADPASTAQELLAPYLAKLPQPVRWVSFREAELIKYGSNLFNATKISFFNALGAWSVEAGADPGLVAALASIASEANWNPDYGFRTIGAPFGGQCLPKDLEAFAAWVDDVRAPHDGLLRAVQAVNEALRQGAPTASTD